ncbi:metal-dependent hydrolase, partial [Enterococcus faecium]|uniref:metal-dependent hydrolase n=1 Tax=Enterococcus faecium TaxID=1352 RepID=UPI003AB068CD
LWFGAVVGPVLGWACWRFFRRRPGDGRGTDAALRAWIAVWTASMISHALLDTCTIYGTQLLQPFSDARFAVPAVGIIDPLYTVILLAAVVSALTTRRWGAAAAWLALLGSTGYLVYGWGENQAVARE